MPVCFNTLGRAPLSRTWALAAGVMAAVLFAHKTASAADYPAQAVSIIVPQAAGGVNDIVARQMAVSLGESLAGNFIVVNKPGAGGNIGTEFAARSKPDGHTLLLTITPHVINPFLYKSVGYDPVKDFEPIALLAVLPSVLVAHPAFPANNIAELIALAKRQPGKIAYGTGGNGSLPHIAGEKLKMDAAISLIHVPYRGIAPAIVDTMAGTIPLAFGSVSSVIGHLNSGKLKALGVTGATRSAAIPNVPTFSESLPGYSMDLWVGLFAIAGTPQPVVESLQKAASKALDSAEIKKQFLAVGAEPQQGTAASFAAKVKSDLQLYQQVVQRSGATVD